MGARPPGMHHALGNALVVEVHDLLAQVEVVEQGGSAVAHPQTVVGIVDRHPGRRGQGVAALGPLGGDRILGRTPRDGRLTASETAGAVFDGDFATIRAFQKGRDRLTHARDVDPRFGSAHAQSQVPEWLCATNRVSRNWPMSVHEEEVRPLGVLRQLPVLEGPEQTVGRHGAPGRPQHVSQVVGIGDLADDDFCPDRRPLRRRPRRPPRPSPPRRMSLPGRCRTGSSETLSPLCRGVRSLTVPTRRSIALLGLPLRLASQRRRVQPSSAAGGLSSHGEMP